MIVKHKNIDLDIYINNKRVDFNINKDIDIDKLRNRFNSTIGDLSQKHHSLEYWTMRMTERNTLIHNLFLDICYIELIEKLQKRNQKIELHTNNIAIFIYFKDFIDISFKDRVLLTLRKIAREYQPYLYIIWFIIKKLLFKIKYSNKKAIKDVSDCTIIQTWVSDANFKNDVFHDTYYKNLSKFLNKHGQKTITWPIFYNIKNERKSVNFIRKNNDGFLLIEDYLKLSDYFFSIKLFFKKRFLTFKNIKVSNNDFTNVFNYYQKQERVDQVTFFYSFIKRLSRLGNENITFIQHHENMIAEKALILAVNKYLTNSKVIGYFHTTKPKNQLCLDYATQDEYKIAPKPDLIIFNSYKYKTYFESRYHTLPMYNGVAFKQLHLRDKTVKSLHKSESILILFSGTFTEIELMFELLNKLNAAYSFIFRMHPMNQFNIKKYYSKTNYTVENEKNLDVLIHSSSKIVSTYSAVAVESALNGVEVGLIYNKKQLLINPFDDTNIENYQLISDKDEFEVFLNTDFNTSNVKQVFNIKDTDYNIFLELN